MRQRGTARSRTWPRRVALTGLALLAIAAAGCGGEESQSSQSLAAFQAEAEPICEQVSQRLAETEMPSSFPADIDDFDTKSKQMIVVIEEPFGQLSSLTPPDGHEAAYERFSAALIAAVAQARQIQTLVVAGNEDTDALWLASTNVATHQAQAMNEAARLGLEHCQTLDYKE